MLLPRITLIGSFGRTTVQQAIDLLTRSVSSQLGKVRVSATDKVLDFLGVKLASGPGIVLSVLNPGDNEQVQISSQGKVAVSAADDVLDFLGAKLAAGPGIELSVLNPGANEQVRISSQFRAVPTAADYPAAAGDYVLCSTTGGAITITLPTAVGASGQMIGVKKLSADGFAANVTAAGGQFIDGQASLSIVGQYNALTVMSDGATWWII